MFLAVPLQFAGATAERRKGYESYMLLPRGMTRVASCLHLPRGHLCYSAAENFSSPLAFFVLLFALYPQKASNDVTQIIIQKMPVRPAYSKGPQPMTTNYASPIFF